MDSRFVNKKQAKGNENIEFGETIVLHRSSQSEVSITPFYIKHSDPQKERDLTVKIVKSKTKSGFLFPVARLFRVLIWLISNPLP